MNPKKKIAEKVLPLLATNGDREAAFNGMRMVTSKGVIKCNTLANVHIS